MVGNRIILHRPCCTLVYRAIALLFLSLSQTNPTFTEVYGFASIGLIVHQTKPETLNSDSHARDKADLKIAVDLQTPCSCTHEG